MRSGNVVGVIRKQLASLALVATALAIGETACAQPFGYRDAYGQKFNYRAMRPYLEITTKHTLAVGVHDQRPYVLSGEKPDTFVGLMRAGFGEPFDVHTQSGQGLSSDVAFGLTEMLVSQEIKAGVVNVSSSASRGQAVASLRKMRTSRLLLLTIHEWKSDTYALTRGTTVVYRLLAELLDENGELITHNSLRGEESGRPLLPPDTMGEKVIELLRGPISAALGVGAARPSAAEPGNPSAGSRLMQQVQCRIGDEAPKVMTRLACSQHGGTVAP